jgi:hypothetical protein
MAKTTPFGDLPHSGSTAATASATRPSVALRVPHAAPDARADDDTECRRYGEVCALCALLAGAAALTLWALV